MYTLIRQALYVKIKGRTNNTKTSGVSKKTSSLMRRKVKKEECVLKVWYSSENQNIPLIK